MRRATDAGHIVTIATGRSWEATSYILHGLAILPEYVVCSNGAAILSRDASQETGYARHTVETFDPSEVLTSETVAEVFGMRSEVVPDPVSGRPLVVPIGRHHAGSA